MAFNDLKRYISNAAKLAGEARKREQASDIAQTIQSSVAQTTVKLPQTQSARQRMMFQEEKQDKWYKNDQPTSSEILARIYTVSQQDFSRGEQLWNTFQTFQNDPASPIYNPYVDATNSAVASMAGLRYKGLAGAEPGTGGKLSHRQLGDAACAKQPIYPRKRRRLLVLQDFERGARNRKRRNRMGGSAGGSALLDGTRGPQLQR